MHSAVSFHPQETSSASSSVEADNAQSLHISENNDSEEKVLSIIQCRIVV